MSDVDQLVDGFKELFSRPAGTRSHCLDEIFEPDLSRNQASEIRSARWIVLAIDGELPVENLPRGLRSGCAVVLLEKKFAAADEAARIDAMRPAPLLYFFHSHGCG